MMNAIRLSECEFNTSDASCRNGPQVSGRHIQLNIFPHEWFQRISRFCRLKHPQSLARTDVSCYKHSECRFFTIVQQSETLHSDACRGRFQNPICAATSTIVPLHSS